MRFKVYTAEYYKMSLLFHQTRSLDETEWTRQAWLAWYFNIPLSEHSLQRSVNVEF